jgi:hypothetical protein
MQSPKLRPDRQPTSFLVDFTNIWERMPEYDVAKSKSVVVPDLA